MSQNLPFDRDERLFAVLDPHILAEVDRIASKYGATREQVLIELLRLDLAQRTVGTTLH